ncbi:MAG: M17 family peptidase N-terminal domain-containing protein, partial [Candidatus Babeliales bacterium]
MITVNVTNKNLFDNESSAYVIPVEQGHIVPEQWKKEINDCFFDLNALFNEARFEGKKGSFMAVPARHKNRLIHMIFVGLGAKNSAGKLDIEQYRRALGLAVKAARKHRTASFTIPMLDGGLFGLSHERLAQETTTILRMASYSFDVYITDDACKAQDLTATLAAPTHTAEIEKGSQIGLIIGHAVNTARYWIDLPPSTLTPPELAVKAQEIADKHG